MQQKADIVSNGMTTGGSIISVLSSFWVWIGHNHDQIAALCAMMGAAIAISGFIYGVYHKRQIRKILMEKDTLEDIPAYIIDQVERRKSGRQYYKKNHPNN